MKHVTDRVIKIMAQAVDLPDFVRIYTPNKGQKYCDTYRRGGMNRSPKSTAKAIEDLREFCKKD